MYICSVFKRVWMFGIGFLYCLFLFGLCNIYFNLRILFYKSNSFNVSSILCITFKKFCIQFLNLICWKVRLSFKLVCLFTTMLPVCLYHLWYQFLVLLFTRCVVCNLYLFFISYFFIVFLHFSDATWCLIFLFFVYVFDLNGYVVHSVEYEWNGASLCCGWIYKK